MFKKRKGFRYIELPDGKFQFRWSIAGNLILYSEAGDKINIPYEIWKKIKNSNEYMLTCPEEYGSDKRQVREAYRKYKVFNAHKLI